MSVLISPYLFAVGATEFQGAVAARLATTPTGLALSSGVTVSFDTEIYDDVSGWAVSPNPERFVAPSDGYAVIRWQVRFENSSSGGSVYGNFEVDGSAFQPNGISAFAASGGAGRGVSGEAIIQISSGQYLHLRAGASFTGADSYINDAVWFDVEFYS